MGVVRNGGLQLVEREVYRSQRILPMAAEVMRCVFERRGGYFERSNCFSYGRMPFRLGRRLRSYVACRRSRVRHVDHRRVGHRAVAGYSQIQLIDSSIGRVQRVHAVTAEIMRRILEFACRKLTGRKRLSDLRMAFLFLGGRGRLLSAKRTPRYG